MKYNKEHYKDPTAAEAVYAADKAPYKVREYIRLSRQMAELLNLDVIGRITVKDKQTGRIYR